MVTESDIDRWYNPEKAGIIVLTTYRSGSTYLRQTIVDHLRAKKIPVVDIHEILLKNYAASDFDSYSLTEQKASRLDYSISNATAELTRPNIIFGVGSVLATTLKHFLYNDRRYSNIFNQYTIVKLVRRDHAAHLMSQIIHRTLNTANTFTFHNGLTPDVLRKYFPEKYELPSNLLISYMISQQALSTLPSDFEIYYDKLDFATRSSLIKNDYGVYPDEFFFDFPAIDRILKNWII